MKASSFLSEGVERLGFRFVIINLLPTAGLALFLFALHASGAPTKRPNLAEVADAITALNVGQSALLGLLVVALSMLLEALQLPVVRFLEGYWGESWVARQLAALGRQRWLQQREKLRRHAYPVTDQPPNAEAAARMTHAAIRLRTEFPSAERLLPTRLGNVLRSAEDRAGQRYGLETVVVWPRLYPLLNEKLAAALDDQRNRLDMAARWCFYFFVAGLVLLVMLWRHGLWLLLSGIAFLGAWLSYRVTIPAALAYGIMIETAFDLHRFDLLKAMNLPLPKDHKDECAANRVLSAFLSEGDRNTNFEYKLD